MKHNQRAANLVHKVHEAIKGEQLDEIILVLACGIGIALKEINDDDERDFLLAQAVRCITKEIHLNRRPRRPKSPPTLRVVT